MLVSSTAQARGGNPFIFDSFSFFKDPLFGHDSQAVFPAPVIPTDDATSNMPIMDAVETKAPIITPAGNQGISQADQFKLQLAIDKAQSRILKLTLDYNSLLSQIERLGDGAQKKGAKWFSFDDGNGKKIEELQNLNRQQLGDKDRQIKVIQTRLNAVQSRYDNENVSRLLAEKRLKILRDQAKKSKAKLSKASKKVNYLAGQLEDNQKVIRQLKIDLTDEKLKQHQPSTVMAASAPAPASAPAIGSASANSTLSLGQVSAVAEWIVKGLKFEEGSAQIKLDSTASLDRVVDYLSNKPAIHAQINGYTDSIGSAESNEGLSQQRAKSVSRYLQDKGIEFHRLKAIGYGERRPIASNDTEQGRAQNRRVAILVLN